MKSAFASISPEVFEEIRSALLKGGHAGFVEKLAAAQVTRCTYSEEDDIGYVYFERHPASLQSANLAAPVAQTIDFFSEHGINLDVDHDGELFGLEFLERADLVGSLKEAGAL